MRNAVCGVAARGQSTDGSEAPALGTMARRPARCAAPACRAYAAGRPFSLNGQLAWPRWRRPRCRRCPALPFSALPIAAARCFPQLVARIDGPILGHSASGVPVATRDAVLDGKIQRRTVSPWLPTRDDLLRKSVHAGLKVNKSLQRSRLLSQHGGGSFRGIQQRKWVVLSTLT